MRRLSDIIFTYLLNRSFNFIMFKDFFLSVEGVNTQGQSQREEEAPMVPDKNCESSVRSGVEFSDFSGNCRPDDSLTGDENSVVSTSSKTADDRKPHRRDDGRLEFTGEYKFLF